MCVLETRSWIAYSQPELGVIGSNHSKHLPTKAFPFDSIMTPQLGMFLHAWPVLIRSLQKAEWKTMDTMIEVGSLYVGDRVRYKSIDVLVDGVRKHGEKIEGWGLYIGEGIRFKSMGVMSLGLV